MLMIIILLYYSAMNALKLFQRDDPDIRESIQHVYYSDQDVFSDDIGIKFALGLGSTKNSTGSEIEFVDEELYGSLNTFILEWGFDGEDNYF